MEISYSASIKNADQLYALNEYKLSRIYIPYDLFFKKEVTIGNIDDIHHGSKSEVYVSLPEIMRKRDDGYLSSLKDFLLSGKADGVLLKNLESIGYINSLEEELKKEYISINGKVSDHTPLYVDCDYSLYSWNSSALSFYNEYTHIKTAPFELSIHELKELEDRDLSIVIYGRALLMVTANCIKKTSDMCNSTEGDTFIWKLKDRKNKLSPVFTNCVHCYNEIYNSVPTSLHKHMWDLIRAGFHDFRIDFTDESVKQINEILTYYITDQRSGRFPVEEYTAAHILKGAI